MRAIDTSSCRRSHTFTTGACPDTIILHGRCHCNRFREFTHPCATLKKSTISKDTITSLRPVRLLQMHYKLNDSLWCRSGRMGRGTCSCGGSFIQGCNITRHLHSCPSRAAWEGSTAAWQPPGGQAVVLLLSWGPAAGVNVVPDIPCAVLQLSLLHLCVWTTWQAGRFLGKVLNLNFPDGLSRCMQTMCISAVFLT